MNSERTPAPGTPDAVKTINGRPVPGSKPTPSQPGQPRSIIGGVKARGDRPGALPVPADRRVAAFSPLPVMERWADDAAGIRPSALEQGDNVITMFDVIGEDWWTGGGVTAKKVAAQLRAIGDRPVEVQINSGGGDMFEGLAIYNVLREHPQAVTIKIMGMAASAASIIAMAGDTVEIGAASFLMIHKCWVFASGNEDDMREVADYLAPFDRAMADVYAQRSGQTVEECAKWMRAETWMSGSVAIERGFADELLSADQTKVDEKAKAASGAANEVRAHELLLIRNGLTRTQARARIKSLKGTPGAAPDPADTPGAGGDDPELMAAMRSLLADFQS
ncbi:MULTISPECIES: head maturation protease, ClpP-related [unclassified Sphingobium]|uniref:head maturation protease, ClpP-related n=1 Tax=unclassified Sphingobium TaxID=2611147 RepID=UPI002224BD4F|nr:MULTISPECIES: head maturation protease, ClpP-related [unclassified Sphingobium]MCW2395882.1 ATP-dependent protease ClpP protease subunit [Sphingobium sp. B8D3B]MCW2419398.1 ATP-dependent protease ClpP protease subunit [Sphingobium sp. B8D3C]